MAWSVMRPQNLPTATNGTAVCDTSHREARLNYQVSGTNPLVSPVSHPLVLPREARTHIAATLRDDQLHSFPLVGRNPG